MRVFDDYADKYDLWYETPFGRSAFKLECECLKRLIPEFSRGLEIGVGTGRFAQALGVKFGVDTSMNMLKKAKERGVLAVLGKAEKLPFKEETFDLVLIVVTLCFVREPVEVLKESKRVLKKGGTLLLGLIPKESRWAEFYKKKAERGHPIYREARFYSLKELNDMLRTAGMKVKKILSTLIEEPQDERPIKSKEFREDFTPKAGFVCIKATK